MSQGNLSAPCFAGRKSFRTREIMAMLYLLPAAKERWVPQCWRQRVAFVPELVFCPCSFRAAVFRSCRFHVPKQWLPVTKLILKNFLPSAPVPESELTGTQNKY